MWKDLAGPLQHHRGYQQNNLQQNGKQNYRTGRFEPIPPLFQKSSFIQIPGHPQSVKRNAYMIEASTAASVDS